MPNCPGCSAAVGAEARFCESCGAPLGSFGDEQRKVVTVLFCDVVDSTALGESIDPEALRALLARYFEQMRRIVAAHGGFVEKFIGDAVMAVFGVPVVHEDDALRACRAAAEMREALPALGIEGRIGVNSGEVVTGTAERLATGDAVNVAARLQQAAEPGEVLIGEATLALVGAAVEADPVAPLALKGKAEPIPAYRLVSVLEVPWRAQEGRFVGRADELALLRESWRRAGARQSCELVTDIGEAGVGKSRLVAESLAEVEARVVQGRCLPYGDGITYWPVIEVMKQLDARPTDPAAAAPIASLLGETDQGTSADEIAWAFRKLLEQEAPLAVVFDDLHWGEETFLDLLEGIALLSSGAPLLLVCMARPELLDRRPQWPVGLWLGPLSDAQVSELIGDRAAVPLGERIARAAGGNPLFVLEMLAMLDQAGGEVVVPPTLRAMLAARLDQLDAGDRRVLERGAVEGEVFHRGAVQALAPEEPQVTHRLAALVRRELIRPEKAQFPGEDGFRFRHSLIRDVAYDALPKATRAELHERFAAWLEEHGSTLVELDEVLGYHLEQAYCCRVDLGPPDAGAEELADRAAALLAGAGGRARTRGDYPTAAGLLERAADLSRQRRLALLPELGETLIWIGDLDRAACLLAEAVELARAAGDEPARVVAEVLRAHVTCLSGDRSVGISGRARSRTQRARGTRARTG